VEKAAAGEGGAQSFGAILAGLWGQLRAPRGRAVLAVVFCYKIGETSRGRQIHHHITL
jgi:hypothetical protein